MPPTYADNAWYGPVTVEENVQLARDTFRVRFACPEIALRVVPGQFVMLRLANCNDPLLGRPLALYDVAPDAAGNPHFVDVVYLVVGKMTRLLAEFQAGAQLEAWGPLGNGFPAQGDCPDFCVSKNGTVPFARPAQGTVPIFEGTVPIFVSAKMGLSPLPASRSPVKQPPAHHLLMVAGGIGQTPFLALAREHLGLHAYGEPPRQVLRANRVTLCYGARSREYLACVEDFQQAGVDVKLSTDDGSVGHRGFVTELIRPVVEQSPQPCRIVCCGPEAMMEATVKIARELSVPCEVSLESPMACGIGICFSCVKKIRDASGGWDYRRTCVEGPVFNGADVEF